ncbi:hypothetical protein V5O48_007341 [Marasmius crinis-equi]|uniref:NmrA-like domain-containing protein n=1 Tax=Marasmius crinis-equi TaxID=585013 RepID=A0ABR3FH67_9AGAR
MSSISKQVVFLVGATGYTGTSIARTLGKEPEKFDLKALIRPSSLNKPVVRELKNLGAEIIPGDIVDDTQETLEEHLRKVDTLIITTIPQVAEQQNKILLAAKRTGVKRVIPSDFGPAAPPGIFKLHDAKLKTRQFIIENNIPHTFIQVGWWASLLLPQPHSVDSTPGVNVLTKQFHGTGKVKTTYTILDRVGEFVARIITDSRTLNQTVQTWDGEATLEEAYAVGSKITGENFDDYPRIPAEEVESRAQGNSAYAFAYEYTRSLYVRGDNTVGKAVASGALDARVLYPDYVPHPLEEFAKELKELGVEIIAGDIVDDTQETIEKHLRNVDTLIISTIPWAADQQNKVPLAAKRADVKRVVPSEFGPSAPPGIFALHDSKLQTRKFIIENNIPYTFIQVGWWASLLLPHPHSVESHPAINLLTKQFYGTGKVKTAYTVLDRIGEFVSRIISDPRTLNQTVQTWDGEATLEEAFAIASEATGENFDDYLRVSAEETESRAEAKDGSSPAYGYSRLLYVRGENTIEKAVARGALDARALYPDYAPYLLDEFAKEYYSDYSKIGYFYQQ